MESCLLKRCACNVPHQSSAECVLDRARVSLLLSDRLGWVFLPLWVELHSPAAVRCTCASRSPIKLLCSSPENQHPFMFTSPTCTFGLACLLSQKPCTLEFLQHLTSSQEQTHLSRTSLWTQHQFQTLLCLLIQLIQFLRLMIF